MSSGTNESEEEEDSNLYNWRIKVGEWWPAGYEQRVQEQGDGDEWEAEQRTESLSRLWLGEEEWVKYNGRLSSRINFETETKSQILDPNEATSRD